MMMAMVLSYKESFRHGNNSSEQRESIAESDKRPSIDSSEDNLTDIIDFEITTGLSQSVLLPLGAMALFAVLVLLVVMFRRHPTAVMTMAAASLLAAGAYNIFLFQTSAAAPPYRDGIDPQKTPKYE